jgi:hypothetical protein
MHHVLSEASATELQKTSTNLAHWTITMDWIPRIRDQSKALLTIPGGIQRWISGLNVGTPN